MKQAFRIGSLAIVFWGAAVLTARAAEDHPPRAYVVLAGINDYADKALKPRKHAEADAKALYDLVVDKKYLGADKENVQLLLGTDDATRASKPATRENILQALRGVAGKADRNDLVVFAFFGDGAPAGDQTCLFGTDSTFKDRGKNGVTTNELEKELAGLKTNRFLALIDADFKGFDAGDEKVGDVQPQALARAFVGKGEKNGVPAKGRALCLANRIGRPSLDLDDHGLFTQTILNGLKGEADQDGYEADGSVTAEELARHLEKQVSELAKARGNTKEEKEQAAVVLGSRANHFSITSNPAASEKVQKRVDKLAELLKEKKVLPDVAEEGHRILRSMPLHPAQYDLRRTYQKLADGDLAPEQFQKDREKCLADIKQTKGNAAAFAKKVMQGVKTLRDSYVKELHAGDMVGWAVDGLYNRAGGKMMPELKQRIEAAKKLTQAELVTLLAEAREQLGKRPDLDNNKDVDYSLQQLAKHLDPHTNYIDSKTVEDFRRLMTGNYTGIGVKIEKDKDRDELRVITPLLNSPAYKAGLRSGDIVTTIIREVDEKGKKLDKPEVIPTKGKAIADLMGKVKGQPGTDVKLVVERSGLDKPLELTVARANISEETVMGVKRKSTDDWDFVIDPESRIGYIRLTQFSEHSAADLKKALAELTKDGVKGLIFDVRNNPGGLLASAVEICRLFVDDGVIVTIKPRAAKPYTFTGDYQTKYRTFPMVCLINGGSASASEIFSACMQDHRRAIVLGERSYGKGSVQNIVGFKPTGAEMKLTTATFWRPNGRNLNKADTKGTEAEDWGVLPTKGFLVRQSPNERNNVREYQRQAEMIHRHDVPVKEVAPAKDGMVESALEYLRGQIKIAAKAQAKKAG